MLDLVQNLICTCTRNWFLGCHKINDEGFEDLHKKFCASFEQCWGIKLLYESNILHITSYFYKEVIYYSYIRIIIQKTNFVILLLLSKVIILCNLITSY